MPTNVSWQAVQVSSVAQRLIEVGLGQDYDTMTLGRTTEAWLSAGLELRAQVVETLDGISADVELIGSSSVLGLLAKPIIDLAVGLSRDADPSPTIAKLEARGWIYRGDARAQGGLVLVLEARPWHRVAHLHIVTSGDDSWRDYLSLRDLLRRDANACARYEAVKRDLARQKLVDRKTYTDGKTNVIHDLLHGIT